MTCVVDGCEATVHARGACANHYARWRAGDPTVPPLVSYGRLTGLDRMNPWRHRAPECPLGHGSDYVIPINEARGFWRCIGLPGYRNGHYVQVAVEAEAVSA